ncbi:MAG: hypothetical protein VKK98_02045 [Cyanobacteriota bacterium]|nr:hypothetical protein [Cyanobacteriota bacterium]
MVAATALELATLEGCGLAIGRYPRFRYNGLGGGGCGVLMAADPEGRQSLSFDPHRLRIPPLNTRTTRFLGLPLPPGLEISIHPRHLAGNLEPSSGELELRFQARFRFRLAGYTAPDLLIDCQLHSGPVQGQRHRASGQPLDGSGQAMLAGVALVTPCGEPWLDRFLGLPDEALALLRCRFTPT